MVLIAARRREKEIKLLRLDFVKMKTTILLSLHQFKHLLSVTTIINQAISCKSSLPPQIAPLNRANTSLSAPHQLSHVFLMSTSVGSKVN